MSNNSISPRAGQGGDAAPVLSSMVNDPDMGDLIELFVQDLPRRVEELQGVARVSDWDGVRRVAHQLKGASGGYGFAIVGTCAGELEARTIRAAKSRLDSDLTEVRKQIDELISLCNRVRAH